jgi:hypothetical protein
MASLRNHGRIYLHGRRSNDGEFASIQWISLGSRFNHDNHRSDWRSVNCFGAFGFPHRQYYVHRQFDWLDHWRHRHGVLMAITLLSTGGNLAFTGAALRSVTDGVTSGCPCCCPCPDDVCSTYSITCSYQIITYGGGATECSGTIASQCPSDGSPDTFTLTTGVGSDCYWEADTGDGDASTCGLVLVSIQLVTTPECGWLLTFDAGDGGLCTSFSVGATPSAGTYPNTYDCSSVTTGYWNNLLVSSISVACAAMMPSDTLLPLAKPCPNCKRAKA